MDGMKTIFEGEIENLVIKAIQQNEKENHLMIALSGAIDTYNSQQFEAILNKLIQSEYNNITFSCSMLNYISSMGIGVFMNMLSKLKKINGTITFSKVQDSVYRVFENLGFANFFIFKET